MSSPLPPPAPVLTKIDIALDPKHINSGYAKKEFANLHHDLCNLQRFLEAFAEQRRLERLKRGATA